MKKNLKEVLNNVALMASTNNTQVLLQESKRRNTANQNMDRAANLLVGLQTTADELMSKNSGMTHTEINKDLFEKLRVTITDLVAIQEKLHSEKIKSINNSLRIMTALATNNNQDTQNFLFELCGRDNEVYSSIVNGARDNAVPLQYALYEMSLSNELLIGLVKILTDRLTSNLDEQAVVNLFYKLCGDLEVHQNDPNLRKLIENNMQQEIVRMFDDDTQLMDTLEKCKRNQMTGFVASGIAPDIINYKADLNRVYSGNLGTVNPVIPNVNVGVAQTTPIAATYGNPAPNSVVHSTTRTNYGNKYTGSLGGTNTGVVNNTPVYSGAIGGGNTQYSVPNVGTQSSNLVTVGSNTGYNLDIANIVNRVYHNQNQGVNNGAYLGTPTVNNNIATGAPVYATASQSQNTTTYSEAIDNQGNKIIIDNNTRQIVQVIPNNTVTAQTPVYSGCAPVYATGNTQQTYIDQNEQRVDRLLHNRSNVLTNNVLVNNNNQL